MSKNLVKVIDNANPETKNVGILQSATKESSNSPSYLNWLRKKYCEYLQKVLAPELEIFLSGNIPDNFNFFNVPEQIWENLSPSQKIQRNLGKLIDQIEKNQIQFTLEEYLQTLLFEAPNECKAILKVFFEFTVYDRKNSTYEDLIQYVISCVESGRPVSLSLSQCIKKAPGIRKGKLEYYQQGKTNVRVDKFCDSVEKKSWPLIKNIFQNANYPINVTIYLGDMDFSTIDGCAFWCDAESLLQLEKELKQIIAETQQEADLFFGSGKVKIKGWSEKYTIENCKTVQTEAATNTSWQTKVFMNKSSNPYFRLWGYAEMAKKLNISPKEMREFVEQDIIRTAGQYRLESRIIAEDSIQGWTEEVAYPTWAMEVSNFDQKGLPPTLLFTI